MWISSLTSSNVIWSAPVVAAVSRIRQGGSLCLYGSNDEGVRSAGPLLESLLREVRTVETRGHCRVWRGIRGAEPDPLRSALSDWETRAAVALDEIITEAQAE